MTDTANSTALISVSVVFAVQFHLKRFRYDASTGDMGKVNSRFDFPVHLDVAPWLSEPGGGSAGADAAGYSLR